MGEKDRTGLYLMVIIILIHALAISGGIKQIEKKVDALLENQQPCGQKKE